MLSFSNSTSPIFCSCSMPQSCECDVVLSIAVMSYLSFPLSPLCLSGYVCFPTHGALLVTNKHNLPNSDKYFVIAIFACCVCEFLSAHMYAMYLFMFVCAGVSMGVKQVFISKIDVLLFLVSVPLISY